MNISPKSIYKNLISQEHPPLLLLWTIFFIYSAAVAVLLQFVALPILFPQLHGGNGLLVGGDILGFHDLAAQLAQRIRDEGWQAWELRPERQGPAGVAAAIYALTVSKPWTLIPLNAALHAGSAILLMQILRMATKDWRLAFYGALPFVLFPSAMMWYAQIHRDGIYFTGIFACLYGWLLLIERRTWIYWIRPLGSYALILVGIGLIWIVRDYGVELMKATGIAFALLTTTLMLHRVRKNEIPLSKAIAAIALTVSIPLLATPITDARFQPQESYAAAARTATNTDKRAFSTLHVIKGWQDAEWLPGSINSALFKIALARSGYIQGYADAKSTIDSDVVFTSPHEFFSYLPRLAQIALLSPFPSHWIEPGNPNGGSAMRKISALEMICAYLALIFLPYALYCWRKHIETWLIASFGLGMTMLYTAVTPNLGALYRMRYGFYMLLIGLGIAGILQFLRGHPNTLKFSRLRITDFNQTKRPLLKACYWYFCFAAITATLLQLIVLPFFLPTLHAGQGMLAGTDAFGFHEIALALANAINEKGWSAWELRPNGQAPAGIAAIFYVLFFPSPVVMIPMNALMHAIAGVALMRIFLLLTDNKNHAFLSTLPFIVFPSAMMWYGQIHKDGFYLAGLYLCIFGWILLARRQSWEGSWHPVALGLFCWLSGAALAGIVRIYAFMLLQGIGYIFALGLAIVFILRGTKRQLPWNKCIIAIAILLLLPYTLRYAPKEVRTSAELPVTQSETAPKIAPEVSWHAKSEVETKWNPTNTIPTFIENNFLKIGVLREGYLTTPDYRTAGSMLDTDVHLYSVGDFLSYFPRAGMLGFAAPFPTDWIAKGNSPGGSIMRKISGLEMLYCYLAFVFIPFAIWHWRQRVEMWLPVVFGSLFIFIYAYSTPNLGSLYRLRYGFLMILVCLGTLGGLNFWHLFCNRNKKILK